MVNCNNPHNYFTSYSSTCLTQYFVFLNSRQENCFAGKTEWPNSFVRRVRRKSQELLRQVEVDKTTARYYSEANSWTEFKSSMDGEETNPIDCVQFQRCNCEKGGQA